MFTRSATLISALWIAICAASPEFIWQGLRVGLGHFTRTDLLSALLLGLILAFFVEPLIRQTGDLLGTAADRGAREPRDPLFTASLSLGFALVSVCVHDAMTAFVSGRGAGNTGGSGLAAAIALTTAWAIVPFAITLAWLSVDSRWLRVPMGIIGGASAGLAGLLFSWSGQEVVSTTIPCLVILGLGYRVVIRRSKQRAFACCAPIVALVGAGWLAIALVLDTFLSDQAKLYTAGQFWVDVRFYLGWALGLTLAPLPSSGVSNKTTAQMSLTVCRMESVGGIVIAVRAISRWVRFEGAGGIYQGCGCPAV